MFVEHRHHLCKVLVGDKTSVTKTGTQVGSEKSAIIQIKARSGSGYLVDLVLEFADARLDLALKH